MSLNTDHINQLPGADDADGDELVVVDWPGCLTTTLATKYCSKQIYDRLRAWDNIAKVILPSDYRTQLDHLIHAGKTTASVHTRARILVLTDYSQAQHRTDQVIADTLQIPRSTVMRVRTRYLDKIR